MSEAERLANLSECSGFYRAPQEVERAMAAELRRLSAINIELLEALKKCLYVVEDSVGDRYWLVQQAARAAIAKAEGEGQ